MADRGHGRGSGHGTNHRQGDQRRRGDSREAGLTFKAVGIPALAAALASSNSLAAEAGNSARPAARGVAPYIHDADDSVALRSGN